MVPEREVQKEGVEKMKTSWDWPESWIGVATEETSLATRLNYLTTSALDLAGPPSLPH